MSRVSIRALRTGVRLRAIPVWKVSAVLDQRLASFASTRSIALPHLTEAATHASEEREFYRSFLTEKLPPAKHRAIDVVVFGSLARGESAGTSDCDYLVVVHDLSAVECVAEFLSAMRKAYNERGLKPPGSTGTFDTFVSSTDIVGRIGLEADSNNSTTRRLLFLAESASVFQPSLRESTVEALLHRYSADYRVVTRGAEDRGPLVPRFLVNDLTRYWRTLTVDFGAKRWNSGNETQFLRRSKLVTTRKVLFAGSVAAAFRPHLAGVTNPSEMIRVLASEFERSPLARLVGLSEFLDSDGEEALERLVRHYDEFIGMVADPDTRDRLQRLETDSDDDLQDRMRGVALGVQGALESLFFDSRAIRELTRQYLVF